MFSPSEIADLEKKYSKYYMKKVLKLFSIIFLSILIALPVGYYILIYNNTTNKKQDKKIINKNKNEIIKPKVLILPKKLYNTVLTKESNETNTTKKIKTSTLHEINKSDKNMSVNKIVQIETIKKKKEENTSNLSFHIEPSNDLSYKTSTRSLLKLNFSYSNEKNTPTKIAKVEEKNDTIKEVKLPIQKVSQKKKPRIKIEMQDIDSVRYLKDKFQNTHNIIFALMLCEEYYSQKNYRESLNWSMIANDIDNQSERSWIWFAKSKYRLGKPNDAKMALKAYLKSNESETIKSLLKKIENGSLDD
ncbi:MAG: hypothetical protein GXP61_09175 [Epsilonproteobacteria bacterium]|nr:hypothetical protein [Campylobacterota bacterium]